MPELAPSMPRPQRPMPASRWQTARPLLVAAAGCSVLALIVVNLARLGPSGRSAAQPTAALVGADLHSVVSLEDGRVFVGGHEAVVVTRDGGRTWSPVPSLDDADAMGWGLTDDAMFVAGHPGLRRSTDAGATFRPVDGLPDPDAHALGAGPEVLYAAGPALGIVASRDDGLTWEQRSSSNGASFFGRIVVDRTNPDRLFAADAQTGPATSSDGGRNWQSLRRPAAVWVSSPDGGTTIYASSGGGQAWRSADGGKNWATLSLPEGAQLVEAAALGDGRKLYAAGRDGDTARLWVSVDAGASWEAPATSRSKS